MDQRNLLLAVVLSVSILLIWQILFEQPRMEKELATQKAAQQQATTQQQPAAKGSAPQTPGVGAPPAPTPTAPTAATAGARLPTPSAPVAGNTMAREQLRAKILKRDQRIRITSPRLRGSIRIKGGQIDDLTLTDYRETVDPNSRQITLLSPSDDTSAYYADFGWWIDPSQGIPVPNADTLWQANRRNLAPGKPVTLRWNNGQGLVFSQIIAIDEDFAFTVTQRVRNEGEKAVVLYPWGRVSRTNVGPGDGSDVPMGDAYIHSGPAGVLGGTLEEVEYDDLKEDGTIEYASNGGWLGMKGQYWMVALVPDQKALIKASYVFDGRDKDTDRFQVGYVEEKGRPLTPGAQIEASTRLFAGAKETRLLERYEQEFGVPDLHMAIDYTRLFFLTIPMHKALLFLVEWIGNFGLAILALTVLIKAAFFPLANKSYKSMSRLKKLAPKMKEIKERYPEDRAKQNEAMMKLYKEENANPMSGCMPMLIQIPVFIGLYIVLFVTIEMRHAPFFGWIQDLSAPDGLGLLTLFGLISWDIPDILQIVNIGVWPLIMGLTMFLQQKLNPAPADPIQAKVFMFLPFVFTFLLARFPAGLVIYWAWNNLLSITQQWIIMRRMGVKVGG